MISPTAIDNRLKLGRKLLFFRMAVLLGKSLADSSEEKCRGPARYLRHRVRKWK